MTLSFDSDWRFLKGDASGAERSDFADAAWLKLDVPHDWSIEGPFDQKNPTGRAGGFLPAGVGWYRKHFTLPDTYAQRHMFAEFDGVMANSDVWINGFHLGQRPFGYVSFGYELTGHLNFGKGADNIIAVRADNSQQPASRWYAGAGIYRHVRLLITDPIHIARWGTMVSTPRVARDAASVHVASEVVNQSAAARTLTLDVVIEAPNGKTVAKGRSAVMQVAAGASVNLSLDLQVNQPQLWNLDQPSLYRAHVRVLTDAAVLDDEAITFGIREFRFEPETGFWLNGRNFKLKGVCLHHDASAFGAAVPLRAWERRLEILRGLGVNAIRTAHNPPAPEFLDLCDRMGFIVMDEFFDCWTVAKNPYDYHLYFDAWSSIDARDTILRDRNHPSIVIYSVGNEIHDTPKAELANRILRRLVAVVHEADPTRPATQALFRPNVSHDYDNGLADLLDVVGQNYRENEILAAHKQNPARKILGTENRHELQGWLALRDNPPYAGQFLWSGIDYLGEAARWPGIAHNSGLLDRTGMARPIGMQRQSWWSNQPMVYIARRVAPTPVLRTDPGYDPALEPEPLVLFSDWTPTSSVPHVESVEVYSNCDEVELFLNNASLGVKPKPANDSARVWEVPFAPGSLRAVAKNSGKVVANYEVKTAGKPARLLLTTDRQSIASTWDDVAYVRVDVVDEHGVLVPNASNAVSFKSTGPGRVVVVDSADNNSQEPFQATTRRAFLGNCFAMVKADSSAGRITLEASSAGLASGAVTIEVRGASKPKAGIHR